MTVQSRILAIRLIKEITGQEQYCEKLGIINASRYRGEVVGRNEDVKEKGECYVKEVNQ